MYADGQTKFCNYKETQVVTSIVACEIMHVQKHKRTPWAASRGLFLILLFPVCDDVHQVLVIEVSCYIWREGCKHLLHLSGQSTN